MNNETWRAELDALLRVWQGRRGGKHKIITTIISRIAGAAARGIADADWAHNRITELEGRIAALESPPPK